MTLNGAQVPVLFGGLTPTPRGLYQIDVQIPAPGERKLHVVDRAERDGEQQHGVAGEELTRLAPVPTPGAILVTLLDHVLGTCGYQPRFARA